MAGTSLVAIFFEWVKLRCRVSSCLCLDCLLSIEEEEEEEEQDDPGREAE